MRIGEVIGKVTLSIQNRKLVGGRFLIVRPHDPQSLRDEVLGAGPGEQRTQGSEPVVAYDELGGDVGQRVGISEGREAAMPFHPDPVAIDAYVACLIDDVTYDEGRGAK
ncbi:MAG: EutN/CcmL family microcompartment protein [Phycisphaerae bacterium]|nr:EutN/CcmL family microcompartment protein [Phycisphaerae bacterium]